MNFRQFRNSLLLPAVLAIVTPALEAQLTTFTYQGQLTDADQPANGSYDFQFGLASAATGALVPLGSDPNPIAVTPVTVTDGVFTVEIDFGANAFIGAERWLEISVRPAGSADPYTTLSPRQRINATPYASFAAGVNASDLVGQVSDANLSTTLSFPRTFSNPGNIFFGDGSNLTGLDAGSLATGTVPTSALGNAWLLGGNSGINPATDFIGTLDSQPLEFRVANSLAFRLQTAGGGLISVIGGHATNTSASAITTIGGGGSGGAPNTIGGSSNASTVSGGEANQVGDTSSASTIGGGSGNRVENDARRSTVGGGRLNAINSGSANSVISGGRENTIEVDAASSSIGGGAINRVKDSAAGGTIAGGSNNTIEADVFSATIGGGSGNTAGGLNGGFPSGFAAVVSGGENNQAIGNRAVVSGGLTNTATGAGGVVSGGSQNNATGLFGTIGGGTDNTAAGSFSTVPGGELNEAFLPHSFAAGYRAKANHSGAFVWADNVTDSDFPSSAEGEFAVRASGGARFLTGSNGISVNDNSLVASSRSTGAFGDASGFDFNPSTTNGLLIEQGIAESAGIYLDGDSITMWSPGDNSRLLRLLDEDGMIERFYIDGAGTVVSTNDIRAMDDLIADGDATIAGNLTFTEEDFGDTARISFLDNSKYIEASGENNAIRLQASLFGFNRFPEISGNAATLQLNGSASKTTAGSWLAHSDERIKTEVETIEGPEALEALRRVRPVSFRYTDAYRSSHDGITDHDYVNVIAQEFAEVFPDWVTDSGEQLTEDEEPLLQVDTYPLTLYSVSAIQELENQLKTHKGEVRDLREENQELRDRLDRLERLIGTTVAATE